MGYLTWEGFENTDYSTGTYIVAHYYDDPRTFAIYDKGIVNLLKLNLTDVAKKVKGNVSGAIGYWAGYGIDIKELIFE